MKLKVRSNAFNERVRTNIRSSQITHWLILLLEEQIVYLRKISDIFYFLSLLQSIVAEEFYVSILIYLIQPINFFKRTHKFETFHSLEKKRNKNKRSIRFEKASLYFLYVYSYRDERTSFRQSHLRAYRNLQLVLIL